MSSNVIKNNDEVIADKGKALLKRIPTKKTESKLKMHLNILLKCMRVK